MGRSKEQRSCFAVNRSANALAVGVTQEDSPVSKTKKLHMAIHSRVASQAAIKQEMGEEAHKQVIQDIKNELHMKHQLQA